MKKVIFLLILLFTLPVKAESVSNSIVTNLVENRLAPHKKTRGVNTIVRYTMIGNDYYRIRAMINGKKKQLSFTLMDSKTNEKLLTAEYGDMLNSCSTIIKECDKRMKEIAQFYDVL